MRFSWVAVEPSLKTTKETLMKKLADLPSPLLNPRLSIKEKRTFYYTRYCLDMIMDLEFIYMYCLPVVYLYIIFIFIFFRLQIMVHEVN